MLEQSTCACDQYAHAQNTGAKPYNLLRKSTMRHVACLQVVFVSLVDPGCFRDIHNFVQHVSGGKGQVDVLSLGVMEQGDAHSQFDAWGSVQSERQGEAQTPEDRCTVSEPPQAS